MMMNFTLSNQVQIPAVGIGTFMMTPDQAEQAVVDALACGYRMIDTAQAYMNERAVGRGIKRSGVAREDIFISTKIWFTIGRIATVSSLRYPAMKSPAG